MALSWSAGDGVRTLLQPLVMLSFAESFAAIESAWSLQQAGMQVVALGRRGSVTALRRAKGIDVVDVTPPEVDVRRTLDDIARALRAYRPDAFLPLDDGMLWIGQHLDFGGCAVAGPSISAAAWALDKGAQLKSADHAGLFIPSTELYADITEVVDCPGPVIIKPADAVRVQDHRMVRPRGRICADTEELLRAQTSMSRGEVIVQPLLSGAGEGVFGLAIDGEITGWSSHRRVRMVNPEGSASSACRSIPVDRDLEVGVRDLVKGVGWQGMFMVEFLRGRDGTPWFMEFNGRAWGSMALARRQGFEYPAWSVQEVLGLSRSPELPIDAKAVTCRHVGREIVHLAFVVRGPRSRGTHDWPRTGRTVLDLVTWRREDRLYNWNHRQPIVLVADTWQTISDQLRSARRTRS